MTPFEIGYGPFVKFDHDFIGREALQEMADAPKRQKVTLALDNDDALRCIGQQLFEDDRAKYMDFPSAVYSMHPFDKVVAGNETIGVSTWVGYSSGERKMLTLAVIDAQHAEPGNEVTLVWGEEGGGSSKPTVENHSQQEIRAIVCPAPYAKTARSSYADVPGWRSGET